MRPLIWGALMLLAGPFAPTAYCQPADPPGLPSDPPVYVCEAMYVPIMVHGRTAHPSFAGWIGTDRARQTTLQAASHIDINESVLTLTLAKPRHRPTIPPNYAQPQDPKRELAGTMWRLGQSRSSTNPPIAGEGPTGYFWDVDRVDCLKTFAVSSSHPWQPLVRDRYEGEADMRTLGTGPGQQWPYAAMAVRLKVQGGVVIGAALDTDYGIRCVPAYAGGHACRNPACARYQVCASPWVYPNVPCATCGQIGHDPTREDIFVSRHATWNMLADAQGDKWSRTTPIAPIPGGGTIAQMHTAAGTPPMAFQLGQEFAYSTSPGPYNAPGRDVPKWNDGIYFVYIDGLRIRNGGGTLGIYADFRIRMWRMWGFDTAGLFGYLADWFEAAPRCDLDGSGCVDASDLFAFLSEWFTGGGN